MLSVIFYYLILLQDDLMAELEELEQEDLDEKLLDVGPMTDNVPSVPVSEPVGKKSQFLTKQLIYDYKPL